MKIIFYSILALCVGGCTEKQLDCYSGSIDDVKWINEEIKKNGYDQPALSVEVFAYQSTYKKSKVFYIHLCCVDCLTTPSEVKTCSGNLVGRLGYEINENALSNKKVIWRTHNGICL